MIPRLVLPTLHSLTDQAPVVAVTEPRQAGKTTLAKAAFPDKPLVSLKDGDQRALATDDPKAFLAEHPNGAVLDEVQRAPLLFS